MKPKTTPIRLPDNFRDLIDNIRSTRRSKVVGIDKKQLSQADVCSLLVQFFKKDNESFLKLIKFEFNNNGQ